MISEKEYTDYKNKLYNIIPGIEYAEKDYYEYNCKRQIYFSKLSSKGLKDMHEYSVLPKFYEHMEMPPHKSIDDTRRYLDNLNNRVKFGYHGGDVMYWFLQEFGTNKVIGTAGLVGVNLHKRQAEIAFGISPCYWGNGYIFEALWLLLKYCFEVLNLNRISGGTQKDNQRVVSVLKTAGFKIEGCLREYNIRFDGTLHDVLIMSLLKREAKLERCLAITKIASGEWK